MLCRQRVGERASLSLGLQVDPMAVFGVGNLQTIDAAGGTRHAVKRDTDLDATVLPILREVSDERAMAKDGRSWFGQHIPKLMRK